MTFHSNENEKKKMARGIISQIKPEKVDWRAFAELAIFEFFTPLNQLDLIALISTLKLIPVTRLYRLH